MIKQPSSYQSLMWNSLTFSKQAGNTHVIPNSLDILLPRMDNKYLSLCPNCGIHILITFGSIADDASSDLTNWFTEKTYSQFCQCMHICHEVVLWRYAHQRHGKWPMCKICCSFTIMSDFTTRNLCNVSACHQSMAVMFIQLSRELANYPHIDTGHCLAKLYQNCVQMGRCPRPKIHISHK